jgi:multicomponent Na+:H+ antiporter subunit B
VSAVLGIFMLTLQVIAALGIVRARNLFVAVMLNGIFSLLMAANFFILDAADVALTEAAVGAGMATVLFLAALALTGAGERSSTRHRLTGLLVVTITAALMIYATFDKPRFGDPDAPVHQHVAPWYIEHTPEHMDFPNVITAVLGSYRGYDTLGEVFVVLTAGVGVLFLLGVPGGDRSGYGFGEQGLRHYLIPRVVGRLVVPFILLFGLYVLFHGEYGPGGGFQAGALIASAFVLFALLEGEREGMRVLPPGILLALMSGGALLYVAVGLAGMVLGTGFLDYSVLATDPVIGRQRGVLLIETGVGITVTGVLLAVYHAFASRGRR